MPIVENKARSAYFACRFMDWLPVIWFRYSCGLELICSTDVAPTQFINLRAW